MSIREFVMSVMAGCSENMADMTVETASIDLANFARDGWRLPDGITAEEYAEIWNELI